MRGVLLRRRRAQRVKAGTDPCPTPMQRWVRRHSRVRARSGHLRVYEREACDAMRRRPRARGRLWLGQCVWRGREMPESQPGTSAEGACAGAGPLGPGLAAECVPGRVVGGPVEGWAHWRVPPQPRV